MRYECAQEMTRQMMAKAVLTKALAVRCKLYLPRAKMMMMVKRTEAVESKKAAALIWMRTVAD